MRTPAQAFLIFYIADWNCGPHPSIYRLVDGNEYSPHSRRKTYRIASFMKISQFIRQGNFLDFFSSYLCQIRSSALMHLKLPIHMVNKITGQIATLIHINKLLVQGKQNHIHNLCLLDEIYIGNSCVFRYIKNTSCLQQNRFHKIPFVILTKIWLGSIFGNIDKCSSGSKNTHHQPITIQFLKSCSFSEKSRLHISLMPLLAIGHNKTRCYRRNSANCRNPIRQLGRSFGPVVKKPRVSQMQSRETNETACSGHQHPVLAKFNIHPHQSAPPFFAVVDHGTQSFPSSECAA